MVQSLDRKPCWAVQEIPFLGGSCFPPIERKKWSRASPFCLFCQQRRGFPVFIFIGKWFLEIPCKFDRSNVENGRTSGLWAMHGPREQLIQHVGQFIKEMLEIHVI